MRTALLVLALMTPQEKDAKLRFLMQHDTGAKDGVGARKLKPEEERALEKEFAGLAAVQSAVLKDSVATLTLKPGASVKLSELRGAGKKAAVDEGFNQIVFNSLKLEGSVTLHLNVEKNRDRVAKALKGGKITDVDETPDGWRCLIKAPGADVLSLIKVVAAKCEMEYRVFEILKDITWHGAEPTK